MKKGFTVAETLLTLAIIGIVASLTLPALQRTKPNQEMIMFQKAYATAGRAVFELINDDALYPDKENPNDSGFSNTDKVEYLGVEYGSDDDPNGYDAVYKFCGLVAAKMNASCNDGYFTTSDGIRWYIPGTNFSKGENESKLEWSATGRSWNEEKQAMEEYTGQTGKAIIEVTVNDKAECVDAGASTSCGAPNRFTIVVTRYGKISVLRDTYAQKYINEKNKNKQYTDYFKE